MERKHLFILLFVLVTFGCAQQNNTINDLIKPINLKEETTTKIVLSDIFYAEDYNLKFLPNKNFDVVLDANENRIAITPINNFSGIELISFDLFDQPFELPVKLELRKKYLFRYKPSGNPIIVNLFGQFNGWNRKNLPMQDEDGDGVYEITVPLNPGRYEYKFFIDNKELIDPENPVKVPNGMGDFNSVRNIEKTASDKHYLHLLNYDREDNTFSYNFYYESVTRDFFSTKDVIALIDNFKIKPENIELDGGKIRISFSKDEMKGNKIIRLAVSKNGKATNFQTVRLNNGLPTGKKGFNDWNDAIIYSVMIDRFYDGDTTNNNPVIHPELSFKANYQGGDLQGIINKLEEGYFDSLGINTFWISPIIDNTSKSYKENPPPHRYFTGYHGYWPVSATEV